MTEIPDAEVDKHIRDLGRLSADAMGRGDRDESVRWSGLMYEAIAARTPATQARRHAEIDRQIDESLGYFQSADAIELGRRLG